MKLKYFMLFFPVFILSQNDSLSISIKKGKSLYEDFCVRCHMPNGKGQKGIIPPLAKSDFLFKHMEESIKALKYGGIDGEIIVNGVKYNSRMEKMGLYDDEIADIMNYTLNSWGNKYDERITEKDVSVIKK
ncbi:MAG: cytochrome c [Flavobacteriaceae bacterium]|nr:cytochrome c [Flavobacteriaceae bacterium]